VFCTRSGTCDATYRSGVMIQNGVIHPEAGGVSFNGSGASNGAVRERFLWRSICQRPTKLPSSCSFWLRKGVDGFRVDVIWHLIKDDQLRDNPINPGFVPDMPPHRRLIPLFTADLPGVHEIVKGLRRVIDEFPERLLIGEIYLPVERLVTYYGRGLEQSREKANNQPGSLPFTGLSSTAVIRAKRP
jgi:hypothetical protein